MNCGLLFRIVRHNEKINLKPNFDEEARVKE